jgi:putative lipase involved disintegration of autophagic bodies
MQVKAHASNVHELLDIAGYWAHANGEINAWIAKDMGFEADGLRGDLNNLAGMELWTATAADCLDITDMGNITTIKADDLELEDAGPDSDSDSDLAVRAE